MGLFNTSIVKELNLSHRILEQLLQAYTFVSKHMVGVENEAVDALSRVLYLLATMDVKVVGFE